MENLERRADEAAEATKISSNRLIMICGEDGKNGKLAALVAEIAELKSRQFRLILFAVAAACAVGSSAFAAVRVLL